RFRAADVDRRLVLPRLADRVLRPQVSPVHRPLLALVGPGVTRLRLLGNRDPGGEDDDDGDACDHGALPHANAWNRIRLEAMGPWSNFAPCRTAKCCRAHVLRSGRNGARPRRSRRARTEVRSGSIPPAST